ncbi:2,3-bisphosphoglycerate-dependent phosphoglycerate mutase [Hymenobacter cellulosivorans]|uniref:2,3-bisphosphoglycerate-dependent phosphoglycerate mutase n=1 Tax=Hymenobacter cellulosivorans TaxID=2932249 RepID=A0ABY4F286_9BACT|nr:2,3-diphosphoglycerate-dependent phosphoglycerate mutase [Hymenobacter cellulosivorans]UOQ50784.1 2,3-diphosphoglycerate-dependent phosphoglycerate mutase [Hymenobacter cellulosivorans]
MATLVLVRHGQSVANLANVFTGWLDVALTPQGEAEARAAGAKLRDFHFDQAYCSTLVRSRHTLELILEQLHQATVPVHAADALRERMYGALQGLNKAETVRKYGLTQVNTWRRSYEDAPPEGETLHHTQERAVAYYEQEIAPQLQRGQHVLVVSHGNTLRALRMQLESLTVAQVEALEIPTGGVRVYELTADLHIGRMWDL